MFQLLFIKSNTIISIDQASLCLIQNMSSLIGQEHLVSTSGQSIFITTLLLISVVCTCKYKLIIDVQVFGHSLVTQEKFFIINKFILCNFSGKSLLAFIFNRFFFFKQIYSTSIQYFQYSDFTKGSWLNMQLQGNIKVLVFRKTKQSTKREKKKCLSWTCYTCSITELPPDWQCLLVLTAGAVLRCLERMDHQWLVVY